MSTSFYMDVHVRRAVTIGLRLRGVDVLTAQEDGFALASDAELLDRATELERILFTQDDDFLREAALLQERGEFFPGVVYAHQLKITIGRCIADLELIATLGRPEDFASRVEHLPL